MQVGGGGGKGIKEISVKSMGERGKDFLHPLLENIDRKRCNDGSREPIPVFHNPHRKG